MQVRENFWLLDDRWGEVSRLDLDSVLGRCQRVVLVGSPVAHGYDAIGATLSDIDRAGIAVLLIDVRMDEPGSCAQSVGGDLRQEQLEGQLITWDLRGKTLGAVEQLVAERLTGLLDKHTLIIAPASPTGTSGEAVIARAVAAAAMQLHALMLEYASWPHDSDQYERVPWPRLRLLAPSLSGLRAKEAVFSEQGSVTASRGGQGAIASTRCVAEIVQVPADPVLAASVDAVSAPGDRRDRIGRPFDAMMTEGGTDDPWHLDDSHYERRRLQLILACLGRPRYRRIVEIGCATGQLTIAMSARADEIVALDPSPKALEVARRSGVTNVRWVLGAVPDDFPDVQADVIVLSEIGYFLDGPDVLATLRAARRHLASAGEIVVANWRRPTEHIPLDGPAVQQQMASTIDLPLRARYEDSDLIIEVWGEPVSVYDEHEGAAL